MERNPWKSTKLSPFDPRRALLTPLPAAAFNTALELARAHCTFTEEFLFHTLLFSFFFIPAHSLWQCHFLLIADFSARADNVCVVFDLREFAYGAMKVGCVCMCVYPGRQVHRESLSSSPRGVLITSKHALKQQAGFMRADTRFSHSELDSPAWEESFLTLMIK